MNPFRRGPAVDRDERHALALRTAAERIGQLNHEGRMPVRELVAQARRDYRATWVAHYGEPIGRP